MKNYEVDFSIVLRDTLTIKAMDEEDAMDYVLSFLQFMHQDRMVDYVVKKPREVAEDGQGAEDK